MESARAVRKKQNSHGNRRLKMMTVSSRLRQTVKWMEKNGDGFASPPGEGESYLSAINNTKKMTMASPLL